MFFCWVKKTKYNKQFKEDLTGVSHRILNPEQAGELKTRIVELLDKCSSTANPPQEVEQKIADLYFATSAYGKAEQLYLSLLKKSPKLQESWK